MEAMCCGFNLAAGFVGCGGHASPYERCTCGIYAVDSIEQLHLNYLHSTPDVVGTVSLWGRVIIAEHGYRAQYAYPVSLFVRDGIDRAPLRAYQVPLGRLEDVWPPRLREEAA